LPLRDTEDLNDPVGKGSIHYWIGNMLGNLGRYDEARDHLHMCLELCQGLENREIEGNAHNYLSQLDYFQGYLKQALEHSEAALACLREIVSPARLAWALSFRAILLCNLRREDDYEAYLNEAEDWAGKTGNDRARCVIALRKSVNCDYLGRYEAGIALALEGVDLAEKIGERILQVMLLAYAGLGALQAGKTEYAMELLYRGQSIGSQVGHPVGLAVVQIYLAKALLRSGRVEEARKTVEKSLPFCRHLDLGSILGMNLEMAAEILANLNPADETGIEEMMAEAFALAERSESNWQRLRHLMAEARINHALGRGEDARMAVAKARVLYREMGVKNGTGELWAIERALEEAKK